MWLAETAVDLESLDIMAEQGSNLRSWRPIRPGVPARSPKSASGIRKTKSTLTFAGRICAASFRKDHRDLLYDGPISQAVAFEGLLHSGESLANRLTGAFDRKATEDQLIHIATDGESYGIITSSVTWALRTVFIISRRAAEQS